MARFGVQDADKYGGQGGGGYFRLANDKETAKVRFLYNTIADVEGFAVHEVKDENDKKRYVNCLREYDAPMSACPFCEAGKFTQVKYFVPLYNLTTQRIETWERGKKFGAKLSSMCARYPRLVSKVFEIERNGKAGDQQTQYEIYPLDGEPEATLEDFDDIPEILGTHVLDKSADEMQYYLDRGVFPGDDNTQMRRRDSVQNQQSNDGYVRRTPANTSQRGRESF